ncbi:PDZ domain-containing protein [Ekhidna sp.]|uniref:PDZ domain-containing protein n=1 Tax=Ekhidna sp. TaxID=2608089 RepID=UPI003297465C
MKLSNQSTCHITFLLILPVLLFTFRSNAQYQSPCERFEKGHTRPNFSITAVVGEQQCIAMARYYEGLTFTKGTDVNWNWNETVSRPSIASQKPAAIPIATGSIAQKYFSSDYIGQCQGCSKLELNRADSKLPDRVAEMAQKCRQAAAGWKEWDQRIANLKKDMQAICAAQAQKNKPSNSSASSNSLTNSSNSSNSFSSSSSSAESKPTSTYSQAKSQQASYQSQRQAEYSRWKAEQDRRNREFNQRWDQIRQQNAQIERQKQQAMDQSLQRFANLINQMAEQKRREDEQREFRINKSKFNKAFDAGKRRITTYQLECRDWVNRLNIWFTEYGAYVDYTIKPKVEGDLSALQKSIDESYKTLEKLYDLRNDLAEDLEWEIMEAKSKSLTKKYEKGPLVSDVSAARNDLRTYVKNNDSPRNRLMYADYTKIAYDFSLNVKKREYSAYTYAKDILRYFPDYPGSSSMEVLIARVEAERVERQENEVMRKSLQAIPTFSSEGKAYELKNLIDSLIMFGDRNAVADAFIGKGGMSFKLEQTVSYGGYHKEFFELHKWFPYRELDNRYRHIITESYIVSKATDPATNRSGSGMGYDNGNLYNSQRKQHRLTLQALINPTDANIKATIKEYKEVTKERKYSEINVTWPQAMFCLMTENYKYLTNQRTSVKYVGLWTRSIDEHAMLEVTKVDKNSPADLNGIKVGDRITRIDGRTVKSMSSEMSGKYNTGINFRGYHPRNKGKTSIKLRMINKNGKEMDIRFPTRISKDNIKKKFAGTRTAVSQQSSSSVPTTNSWPAHLAKPKLVDQSFIDSLWAKAESADLASINKRGTFSYPRRALSMGVTGVIYIEAFIDAKGNMKNCNMYAVDEKSRTYFTSSTVRYLEGFEFNPAEKDGVPVDGMVLLKHSYTLTDE